MQLSVRDVAKLLQTTDKQVYKWVDEDAIPFEMTNEQPRFNRSEVLEWATGRGIAISPSAFRRLESSVAPMPSLAFALARGGVHRIDALEPAEVLRRVVDAMPVENADDRESLYEVLAAREGMGLTPLGDGIAIPHVLAPAVLPGSPISVTVCYLDHPIDLGAPDKLPVHTVFSIISANIPGHLELLANLAAALHVRGFRAALERRASLGELAAEVPLSSAEGQ